MSEARVEVPDIGDATDVDVVEVLVKPGMRVERDQSLIVLESDKASMEVPSPFAGTIKSVALNVGDKVSQGVADPDAGHDGQAGGQAGARPKPVAAPPKPGAQPARPAPASEPAPACRKPPRRASAERMPRTRAADGRALTEPAAASAASRRRGRHAHDPAARLQPVPRRADPPAEATRSKPHADAVGAPLRARARRRPHARAGTGPHAASPRKTCSATSRPRCRSRAPLPARALPCRSCRRSTSSSSARSDAAADQDPEVSGRNLLRNWVMIPHVTQFDDADITGLEDCASR